MTPERLRSQGVVPRFVRVDRDPVSTTPFRSPVSCRRPGRQRTTVAGPTSTVVGHIRRLTSHRRSRVEGLGWILGENKYHVVLPSVPLLP